MSFTAVLADRGRIRRIRIIGVLAATQLIGWGTASDMIGVLGWPIARDLNVANEIAFLGLGVSLVVSGLLGPLVGGWLKRFGAVPVLAGGSLAIATGLMLIGSATDIISYFAAWLIMGLGAALGLSAAAYTAIVEREGNGSKQVIGSLMILTGLSSAIFWPVVSALYEAFGWRTTCWLMAAMNVAICLPLHLFALPERLVHSETSRSDVERAPVQLSVKDGRKVFMLIALATTLFSFMGLGVSATFLELMRRAGAPAALALQLGSIRGVLAISARLVDMLLGKRSTPVTTAMAAAGLLLTASALLLCLGGSPIALIAFVILNGFGAGIASLARVLLPLSFFAVSDYGRQASRLTLPQNFANAAAPAIFTALLDRGGVEPFLLTLLLLSGLSAVAILALAVLERRHRS